MCVSQGLCPTAASAHHVGPCGLWFGQGHPTPTSGMYSSPGLPDLQKKLKATWPSSWVSSQISQSDICKEFQPSRQVRAKVTLTALAMCSQYDSVQVTGKI